MDAANNVWAGASERVRGQLKRIWAPVNVGVPPTNAYRDLMALPDGEIRHYGFRMAGGHGEALYLSSRDCGLSWQEYPVTTACLGASVQSPWSRDWLTIGDPREEFIEHSGLGAKYLGAAKGLYVCRSTTGADGPFSSVRIAEECDVYPRLPIPLRCRKRWIFSCQCRDAGGRYHPVVFRSDDDGRTWARSMLETVAAHEAKWPHEGIRWQNWALEPTVVELSSGRLWLVARTSQDQHYESFSDDGGETWTTPAPSRFYGTLTMPTLFRLADGRIILFWCNTTPLPELNHDLQPELLDWERQGLGEDIFTNRDAFHAAISEDDGQTWIGFREINLNERRNDSDFRTSGGNAGTLDKSLHQSQAVELPEGKILVAHGQHPLCRRFVIFDPGWLYETQREDGLRFGLGAWSTFQYVKGIVGNFRGVSGHCAYNRRPGAQLIPDPEGGAREALQIARHPDARLVQERQGAVWNFPAGKGGALRLSVRVPQGSQGFRICLVDRWFNPIDPVVQHFAQYVLEVDGQRRINKTDTVLPADTWQEVLIRWTNTERAAAQFSLAPNGPWQTVPLGFPSVNGLSYLHIQSTAEKPDLAGVLLREVKAEISR